MENGAKYEVNTYWGWFRLDEGAYRDYLAGRLWICRTPGARISARSRSSSNITIIAISSFPGESS